MKVLKKTDAYVNIIYMKDVRKEKMDQKTTKNASWPFRGSNSNSLCPHVSIYVCFAHVKCMAV